MTRTLASLFVFVLFACSSCIERYYPGEEELNIGSLAVSAHLSSIPGIQTIQLSRSVSVERSLFDPVSDCYLEVERSDGEIRIFEEEDPGYYSCDLDASFLRSGDEFRMSIITPEGKIYESDYERQYPARKIESVYYELETLPTADPAVQDPGIRFFVDFEIEKDSGRFLRWEMNETFEVHNPDYPTRMYGVDRRWYDILSEEKWLKCWLYRDVNEIFTLDLKNVAGDFYKKFPLNFVSGSNRKLLEGYSLLVRQYSHSEGAFWYWNELAKNVQSKGGLFDTQPALTPSNIYNTGDEDELVIGYFSISGVSEQRIFVGTVPGLELYRDPYFCSPGVMPRFLWNYPQDQLPFFVAQADIQGIFENGEVKDECVDCRQYKNSTSEEPDYWRK